MKKASNNQIKLLRKLGQKKHREKESLFIVEGERAVEQVLENGVVKVKEVFVEQETAVSYQQSVVSSFHIDPNTFSEISATENPQGILAVCEIPKETTLSELKKRSGLIIATDRIQDPGNLGTIVRTGVWFGASAILLGKGTVDLFNPKVVRSTAGATGNLAHLSSDLDKELQEFEKEGWKVLLLDGNPGAEAINKVKLPEKTILIVGNEANGVNRKLISPARKRVLIPAVENNRSVESLNAAIALSIALYEFSK
ncbi:MAG: RNA methyltransferase [Balneola sp.]